jgi:hypothetical protein
MLPFDVKAPLPEHLNRFFLRLRGVVMGIVVILLIGMGAGLAWMADAPRSVDRAIARLHYSECLVVVDSIYSAHGSAGDSALMFESDTPSALRDVAKRMRVTQDGIFLSTHRFFVSDYGLYIARGGHAPDMQQGGDPTFTRVRDRLYRYVISG